MFFLMTQNKELIINWNNLFYVYTSQLWDCTNIYLSLIDKMDDSNILLYDDVINYLRRQLNMRKSNLESAIRRLAKERLLLKHQKYIFINPYVVSTQRWWGKSRLCSQYDYWINEIHKPKWFNNSKQNQQQQQNRTD